MSELHRLCKLRDALTVAGDALAAVEEVHGHEAHVPAAPEVGPCANDAERMLRECVVAISNLRYRAAWFQGDQL